MILQITNSATKWLDKFTDTAISFVPKLLGAVLVYIIGSWLIKKLMFLLNRIFASKNYDPSLQKFLISLIRVSLMILLVITVIGMIGVETTSLAALIAGAGLAIGASLNGSLGNLAGGVMILAFRPYKIGDLIEAQGQLGIVKEIGIFHTTLISPDSKTIIVPNGALSTGVISNFNTHGYLRVDLVFSIAGNEDIDKARDIAMETMKSFPGVLAEPSPEVNVNKIDMGRTELAVRPYTTQDDYWNVYFGVQEALKKAWDKNNINGPIPLRIVKQA